jgi:hypothetical protein
MGRKYSYGAESSNGNEHGNAGSDVPTSYGTKHQDCFPNQRRRPDVAIILSVLSCYLRLLDIYSLLLANSWQFTKHGSGATAASESGSRGHTPSSQAGSDSQSLPIFNVGSFSLLGLHDLNVSMQLHMISRMLKRVQKIVSECVAGMAPELSNTDTDPSTFGSISPQQADKGRSSRQGSMAGQSQWSDSGMDGTITSAAEVALIEIRSKEWLLWDQMRNLGDALGY